MNVACARLLFACAASVFARGREGCEGWRTGWGWGGVWVGHSLMKYWEAPCLCLEYCARQRWRGAEVLEMRAPRRMSMVSIVASARDALISVGVRLEWKFNALCGCSVPWRAVIALYLC